MSEMAEVQELATLVIELLALVRPAANDTAETEVKLDKVEREVAKLVTEAATVEDKEDVERDNDERVEIVEPKPVEREVIPESVEVERVEREEIVEEAKVERDEIPLLNEDSARMARDVSELIVDVNTTTWEAVVEDKERICEVVAETIEVSAVVARVISAAIAVERDVIVLRSEFSYV